MQTCLQKAGHLLLLVNLSYTKSPRQEKVTLASAKFVLVSWYLPTAGDRIR